MMKQHTYSFSRMALVAAVIMGALVPVQAARYTMTKSHWLGISGDLGWSSVLTSPSVLADGTAISPSAHSYGLQAGLTYEYNAHHFLVQTGAAFRWQNASLEVSDMEHTTQIVDITRTPHEFTYHMRHREDCMKMGYVELPLMLGGVWNHFYMMAGVKARLAVMGSTEQHVRVTTTASYDRFNAPQFSGMPGNGLQNDVPVDKRGDKLSVYPDLSVGAEFGLNVSLREASGRRGYTASRSYGARAYSPRRGKDTRFRVGLFADYGVFSFNTRGMHSEFTASNLTPSPLYSLPNNYFDLQRMGVPNVLSSSLTRDMRMNNLFVGLRFTLLWSVAKQRYRCLICENEYRHRR